MLPIIIRRMVYSRPIMGHFHEEKIALELVKQFKAIRQEQGLSHQSLAKKAGVTRAAISHIENGIRKPSLMMALRLSDALGIKLSTILQEIENTVAH